MQFWHTAPTTGQLGRYDYGNKEDKIFIFWESQMPMCTFVLKIVQYSQH